jgi:hypothetical protein
MKSIKLIPLAVLLAVAITVVAAGGSASAVTLCKENKNPCPESMRYKEGGEGWSHAKEAILSGPVTVLCKETWHHDKSLATSGSPLLAETRKIEFVGCTGCKQVTAQGLSYETEMTASGGGNGVLTMRNIVLQWNECNLGLKCTARAAKMEWTFEGGPGGSEEKDAKLKAEKEPLSMEGLGCGTTGEWNGTFILTEAQEKSGGPVKNPAVWLEKEP